jgi:hypothetical protein
MRLARTGATSLDLIDSPQMLKIRAMVDQQQSTAADLIQCIHNGTGTQMSVGMIFAQDADEWSGQDERGLPSIRVIRSPARFVDCSAVTHRQPGLWLRRRRIRKRGCLPVYSGPGTAAVAPGVHAFTLQDSSTGRSSCRSSPSIWRLTRPSNGLPFGSFRRQNGKVLPAPAS